MLRRGDVAAEIEGLLAGLLIGERTALNFLQLMSGIATKTAEFARAVAGTKARVVDTRKTHPGLRAVEKYAVHIGGGNNHRFSLDSGVLIKGQPHRRRRLGQHGGKTSPPISAAHAEDRNRMRNPRPA